MARGKRNTAEMPPGDGQTSYGDDGACDCPQAGHRPGCEVAKAIGAPTVDRTPLSITDYARNGEAIDVAVSARRPGATPEAQQGVMPNMPPPNELWPRYQGYRITEVFLGFSGGFKVTQYPELAQAAALGGRITMLVEVDITGHSHKLIAGEQGARGMRGVATAVIESARLVRPGERIDTAPVGLEGEPEAPAAESLAAAQGVPACGKMHDGNTKPCGWPASSCSLPEIEAAAPPATAPDAKPKRTRKPKSALDESLGIAQGDPDADEEPAMPPGDPEGTMTALGDDLGDHRFDALHKAAAEGDDDEPDDDDAADEINAAVAEGFGDAAVEQFDRLTTFDRSGE